MFDFPILKPKTKKMDVTDFPTFNIPKKKTSLLLDPYIMKPTLKKKQLTTDFPEPFKFKPYKPTGTNSAWKFLSGDYGGLKQKDVYLYAVAKESLGYSSGVSEPIADDTIVDEKVDDTIVDDVLDDTIVDDVSDDENDIYNLKSEHNVVFNGEQIKEKGDTYYKVTIDGRDKLISVPYENKMIEFLQKNGGEFDKKELSRFIKFEDPKLGSKDQHMMNYYDVVNYMKFLIEEYGDDELKDVKLKIKSSPKPKVESKVESKEDITLDKEQFEQDFPYQKFDYFLNLVEKIDSNNDFNSLTEKDQGNLIEMYFENTEKFNEMTISKKIKNFIVYDKEAMKEMREHAYEIFKHETELIKQGFDKDSDEFGEAMKEFKKEKEKGLSKKLKEIQVSPFIELRSGLVNEIKKKINKVEKPIEEPKETPKEPKEEPKEETKERIPK